MTGWPAGEIIIRESFWTRGLKVGHEGHAGSGVGKKRGGCKWFKKKKEEEERQRKRVREERRGRERRRKRSRR